ncbi:MAG TPA: hypothetical protein VFA39_01965 [Steroidobacteraceae bacterium]|nr:hypothetical protein [Steroidobacteraceae bacterium]
MNPPPDLARRDRAKPKQPLAASLSLLLILAAIPAVRAAPPETPVNQLLACRHIAADAARLRCFDRVSAAVAESAQRTARAMKEALNPQRTFGLSHATIVDREAAAAGVRVKSVATIDAHVVHIGQGPDGRAMVSLDNGQVWEQLVPDGTDLYAKPGDSVRITRGWLDSYWLEASSHHGFKVMRVR